MATASQKTRSSIIVTRTMVWVFILGYGVFLVAQSTYQNYKMNRDIQSHKKQIALLEKNKKSLSLDLVYYQSNAYKEVEARRRLNLKGLDEHVVALPQATSEPVLSIVTSIQRAAVPPKALVPYIAWWN